MSRADDSGKDALLREVVLHLRDPRHFGCRRLSHEEISSLMGRDRLSRVTYCNDERAALAKLRNRLVRMGISSAGDVLDFGGGSCPSDFGSVDPEA